MEKFKKKLIICAALLLACVAYQFVYDQFLHPYYMRYYTIGSYAMFLLVGVVKPLQYFLIGFLVVLLYQNIFSASPQLPHKFKPICKIVSSVLMLACSTVVVLWVLRINAYPLIYYIFNYAYLFVPIGALWQLGSD